METHENRVRWVVNLLLLVFFGAKNKEILRENYEMRDNTNQFIQNKFKKIFAPIENKLHHPCLLLSDSLLLEWREWSAPLC